MENRTLMIAVFKRIFGMSLHVVHFMCPCSLFSIYVHTVFGTYTKPTINKPFSSDEQENYYPVT